MRSSLVLLRLVRMADTPNDRANTKAALNEHRDNALHSQKTKLFEYLSVPD